MSISKQTDSDPIDGLTTNRESEALTHTRHSGRWSGLRETERAEGFVLSNAHRGKGQIWFVNSIRHRRQRYFVSVSFWLKVSSVSVYAWMSVMRLHGPTSATERHAAGWQGRRHISLSPWRWAKAICCLIQTVICIPFPFLDTPRAPFEWVREEVSHTDPTSNLETNSILTSTSQQ